MNVRSLLFAPLVMLALPAQAPGLTTARLEGQVVDAMYQPVGNALVVAELDGEEIARTQSDASGTFVFAKVPQQFVVVRATTAAPDIGAVQVDLLGEVRGFARVVLMPARKVSGVVKDEAGKPVAGAWVLAAPSDALPFACASCRARSDAQGHYELTHVTMGRVNVRAWAAGCDAFEGELDPPRFEESPIAGNEVLDCVVDTEGRQVRTFVLVGATAEQLARAALRVQAFRGTLPTPLPPPLLRPEPTAPGTWVVRGWPNDDELWASLVLPGALVEPALHVVTAGVGERGGTFRIVEPAECVTGALVGEDGLATAGRLLLAQPCEGPVHNATRILARSAADGSFVLRTPVAPGEKLALRVIDPDAVVANGNPDRCWFVAAHRPGQSHGITLRPAGSIRLRVVTADETPVHGASVLVFKTLSKARELVGIATALRSYSQPLAFGVSDLDGNVAILGLDLRAGDEFACLVTHPKGFVERPFTIDDIFQLNLGQVVLSPAATLVVTARHGGNPSARLRMAIQPPTWWTGPMLVMPGRDGRLALPGLLPGDYSIAYPHGVAQQHCDLVAGEVTEWPAR